MSEKLTRFRCPVHGHGTKCVVSDELKHEQGKKYTNKKRRAMDKKEIRDQL